MPSTEIVESRTVSDFGLISSRWEPPKDWKLDRIASGSNTVLKNEKSIEISGKIIDGIQIGQRRSTTQVQTADLDGKAKAIFHKHLLNSILVHLEQLESMAQTPAAAIPAQRALQDIRRFVDVLDNHPLAIYLASIHDIMAFDDQWATLSKQQLGTIRKIALVLARTKQLTLKKVSHAIGELSRLGVDVLPLGNQAAGSAETELA